MQELDIKSICLYCCRIFLDLYDVKGAQVRKVELFQYWNTLQNIGYDPGKELEKMIFEFQDNRQIRKVEQQEQNSEDNQLECEPLLSDMAKLCVSQPDNDSVEAYEPQHVKRQLVELSMRAGQLLSEMGHFKMSQKLLEIAYEYVVKVGNLNFYKVTYTL